LGFYILLRHKSHFYDLHPKTYSKRVNRIVKNLTILAVPIKSAKSGLLGREKHGANTTAQLYSVILVIA
jgi:hypothetical protein